MIPDWLSVLLAVVAIVGPWVSGYFGAQRGLAVEHAGLKAQVEALKKMVERNDEFLWNQIGRSSEEGMRKILHGETGARAALFDMERRLDRIERRGT